MYTIDDLKKYDYFKNVDVNYALDSLTGVLTRGYILGYTKYLIDHNIPFCMGMIDIDNFKLINDNNGHDFGDQCLTDVVGNIAEYFKNDGLVGRYGGDEFIFLYFGENSYDNIHKVIENMYNSHLVFRKKFSYKNFDHFVTATTGCSSFPKDAQSYSELFSNVDKSLYIGKSKGRNCYIIYVKDKHQNVDVHKKETSSFHTIYSNINKIFENQDMLPADSVVQKTLNYLNSELHYSQSIYIKKDGSIITNQNAVNKNVNIEDLDFIQDYFEEEDEIYVPRNINYIRKVDKNFQNIFNKYKFITLMASKIEEKNNLFGYLVLCETRVERVWQEKDIAILMYIDRQIQHLYNQI